MPLNWSATCKHLIKSYEEFVFKIKMVRPSYAVGNRSKNNNHKGPLKSFEKKIIKNRA